MLTAHQTPSRQPIAATHYILLTMAKQKQNSDQRRAHVPTTDTNPTQLERGTYEIIRQRLATQGDDLKRRLNLLNESRREVFGSIPTELLSTERITTANNCIPRDMVPVAGHLVFGYNVQFGLKTETLLEDVFAVYGFSETTFHEQALDLLDNKLFREDFHQLYKYYKGTRFVKFHVAAPYIYFVFQIGKSHNDIKAFKWRVAGDSLEYIDNRSEFEIRLPAQHSFQWTRAGRDFHRTGRHPHISIEDIVFVETIGGDLTIKVEDNTESGSGIYAEPVEDADQTLDDAETFYAVVGNVVLLKIRPFKEQTYRYIVFNRKTQTALRIDSIARACILLPEGHGLIFANGYYLQTGEYKVFDTDVQNLLFERHIAASNGEDHLYVFYNPLTGEYVLLSYNMIEQQVATPVMCHGYSFFDNGHLVFFRDSAEPQKHHALQVWQTPYVAATQTSQVNKDSMLYKIGNRDIVRGMAECHEIINLIGKDDAYADLYLDLVKKSTGILDSYFWLNETATHQLAESLKAIRESAKSAVDEFEKVVTIRNNTRSKFQETKSQAEAAISQAARLRYQAIDDFVSTLSELRSVRGRLISLRELKYIDLEAVAKLETAVEENANLISRKCIEFLAQDSSLAPYQIRVDNQRNEIESVKTAAESKSLDESLAAGANELEMLIEIVSNLKIDDATQRTKIIDNISTIYSHINQTRATLKKRTRELLSSEGAAEFASQLKLLSQAVINYLDVCDSPERCDEYLTKLMVQVEELEGRFAEFDDFVVQLAEKRDEFYSAFDTKKMQIIEGRNRRAAALMSAADRILAGVKSRVANLDSIDEINSYFAADMMIEKVREIVNQLQSLNESVKVDDLQSRMKSIREETIRQLRDKKDLFVDGKNMVRFGRHQFSVNIQQLDLTTLTQEGKLFFHLTGTKFLEAIQDDGLNSLHDVWTQELISENSDVYRGEYLAHLIFQQALKGETPIPLPELSLLAPDKLVEVVRDFMAPRYREGYVKGVHDHDAALILHELLRMHSSLGLLQYDANVRAAAHLWLWHDHFQVQSTPLLSQIPAIARAHSLFNEWSGRDRIIAALARVVRAEDGVSGFPIDSNEQQIAQFLFDEFQTGQMHVDRRAFDLADSFLRTLEQKGLHDTFRADFGVLDMFARFELSRDWLNVFAKSQKGSFSTGTISEAATLVCGELPILEWRILEGQTSTAISGAIGEHPRLTPTGYEFEFIDFRQRLNMFETTTQPRFEKFVHTKQDLLTKRREELRLDEFKPRVLTSFVRNKLINEVYLPLVGDNLAKQMGSTGEQKRTDLMGLLLLISPPGYGKTTLMEYIANRLGLTFVKINGPAIGHRVTSLDPQEANNASAREEVEKLNLALEMGDNVMIYVDDIQHCNPEFLQKFISLCDATRRIEGVFRSRPRTYDLRGRKVCVVMAGNPYTESGEKFQIPDMLANRADTYNLGDVIGEHLKSFELSYLENALTSNPSLQRLNSGNREDIYALIEMSENEGAAQASLQGNYTVEEINEMVSVLRKMIRVRSVLLKVNRQYIDSAAQADAYRVEPPFRMQGSYRDMNKLSEKIVPIMNDGELDQIIIDHYENQAQTLTTGAESNLLKFREILGILSTDQQNRWDEIKRTFKRNLVLGAAGNDNVAGQLIGQISTITEGLSEIRGALSQGLGAWLQNRPTEQDDSPMQQLTLSQLGAGVNELAKFNQSLEEIKGLLAQQPASGEAARSANEPQRIQVVNKVPQAFLEIIRYQFETLQHWLDPLTKLAESNPPAKQVSQKAKRIARQYKEIVKELEKTNLDVDSSPEM